MNALFWILLGIIVGAWIGWHTAHLTVAVECERLGGFFVGKLGLEAEKGDWTYGLGYACQKGSHAQNSKFMLNVTYSF